MILRRLSQSLKAQNWTAIWIEFILLVSGVFLGIQVSNWNQQRVTDNQARVFTERLRQDLSVEVWSFEALNRYYDDVLANANLTLDALEGRAKLSNEALLIAAYRATQYTEFVQYRATYDELTSTGNIGLIRDLKLHRLATETYGTKLYENVKNEGINSKYRVAFRMLVPMAAQVALSENCGDRDNKINDFASIQLPLNYPCKTGLPMQDIDQAAGLVRGEPALAPLLRLRMADIRSAMSSKMMSDDVLDSLRAMSKGAR